jgi:hypothetical protein
VLFSDNQKWVKVVISKVIDIGERGRSCIKESFCLSPWDRFLVGGDAFSTGYVASNDGMINE